MRCSPLLAAILLSAQVWGGEPSPGLDVEDVEARALKRAEGLQDFAAEVMGRAGEWTRAARDLAESSGEIADLDWDSLAGLAPTLGSVGAQGRAKERARVMVFASLSMPDAALRRLLRDAARAEIPVYLRGFLPGGLKPTLARLRQLVTDTNGRELSGAAFDPRAFRIFGITAAPTFVAAAGAMPDCDGLDCSAAPPPHDRIAGNISLGAALDALADEGTAARAEAAAALGRLREGVAAWAGP